MNDFIDHALGDVALEVPAQRRRYTRLVDVVTFYGLIAVGSMLLFYALESRGAVFVLLFAGSCLASAVYGVASGAWPFGIVESVWSVIAFVRWRRRLHQTATQTQ